MVESVTMGKSLIVIGVLFVVVGVLISSGYGASWFGKLPGDFNFKEGNFSFYFPMSTCIVLSIVLTILFRIFNKK